jgi:hypothetical protein
MEKGEIEEVKKHFNVLAEGLKHKIHLVTEGIRNVDKKIGHLLQEVKEEFKETRT